MGPGKAGQQLTELSLSEWAGAFLSLGVEVDFPPVKNWDDNDTSL